MGHPNNGHSFHCAFRCSLFVAGCGLAIPPRKLQYLHAVSLFASASQSLSMCSTCFGAALPLSS